MSIINEEIEELIKQKVHLEILRKAVEFDRAALKQTKMKRIYNRLFDHIMDQIAEALQEIKKELHRAQAQILEEEQRSKDRRIVYRYQGYIFEKEYFNPLIKIECENLLATLLKL